MQLTKADEDKIIKLTPEPVPIPQKVKYIGKEADHLKRGYRVLIADRMYKVIAIHEKKGKKTKLVLREE